ncbi:hypothetical protein KFK09_002617 [Dendrobium nobile]|uniref:Uncharacterized protein n=1 Tax=Dendrobium nobile TaxID=94219 RepID=A0A8T3C1U7_DENNO|nr:hypothetical protein KFK09_002617 [Dendrobium nobile]
MHNFKCVASFIFACSNRFSRMKLWGHLSNISSLIDLSWLVGGDFNTISSLDDRLGAAIPNALAMEDFKNMILDCNLIYIGYSCSNFMWNCDNLWQRLDRVLFNNQ